MNISAVLCTCNEDFYLEQCLQSLSFADEIIVCDMGSTDRTLEIAGHFGATIKTVPKVEYVELIRKQAVGFCANDWICFADPDFILPAGYGQYVKSAFESEPDIACFQMCYINHFAGRPIHRGRWGGFIRYPILFLREAMNISTHLHGGFLLRSGKVHAVPQQMYIKHMWMRSEAHFIEKAKKYIQFEGATRFSKGCFPSPFRIFKLLFSLVWYYIGKGGFLDGRLGLFMVKKSIWYEMESEQQLSKYVKGLKALCPVCGKQSDRPFSSLYDDRYGYPGGFPAYKCKNCGHQFLGNVGTLDVARIYTDYYPRSRLKGKEIVVPQSSGRFASWFNGTRSSAFRWVPANVTVLDIGCGFCESLAYLKNRGCTVYGVEADENVRETASRYGFNVHIGEFDQAIYKKNTFDYVIMDQVIEHMRDPVTTLHQVNSILKQGGKLILSTPNAKGWAARIFGRRWINRHAPFHSQGFGRRSIKSAAGRSGFNVKMIRTITNPQWLHYQWVHLLTAPNAGTPSPFWAPGNRPSRKMILVSYFFSVFNRLKINHVITRFFDMIQMGDNLMVILQKK
jgi:SAM-dependent methyltransferase/glycosyltransferase involved in cell wall biosynthesis